MDGVSVLETYEVKTGRRETLRMFSRIVEAPIWGRSEDELIYSSLGRLWLYSISRDQETLLDTGNCRGCVNDYVLSRDGKTLYFNNVPFAPSDWSSYIHAMPLDGSEPPRLALPHTPSYVHSITAAGDLLFSGRRPEFPGQMDIFLLPADGGRERRLTDGVGYNDGPELSPDGSRIWFCSSRGGSMQIWVMDLDGGHLRQITHSEQDCWFPHFSPDGSMVLYLSFSHDEDPTPSTLIQREAVVRTLSPDGAQDRELFRFTGGQCTINSNSWSPDSTRFAFISYR